MLLSSLTNSRLSFDVVIKISELYSIWVGLLLNFQKIEPTISYSLFLIKNVCSMGMKMDWIGWNDWLECPLQKISKDCSVGDLEIRELMCFDSYT